MSKSAALLPVRLVLTIRFIRGYRYLDRCGDVLVRLEDVLSEGWIPTETKPSAGQIVNHTLGMAAGFDSSHLTVNQSDFLSFEHFLDESCKIFQVLWTSLEIERINVPCLQVFLQRGFDEESVAEKYFRDLGVVTVSPAVQNLLGGDIQSLRTAIIGQEETNWNGEQVLRRRRLNAGVIRQVKQPGFDDRLLQRARLLSERQRDAMQALAALRKKHPESPPIAVEFELEQSLDSEFSTSQFDLSEFLADAWKWASALNVNEFAQTNKV